MYKEEKIKKIRKVLKDKLCKYKGKELLKIEKDILEDILFDKISYETENNKKINIKIPIFSGKFLSKLDLSEVDFSNVTWSFLGSIDKLNFLDNSLKEEYLPLDNEKTKEILKKYLSQDYYKVYTDYSNTNALIKFDNSFEGKYKNNLEIYNTNFSNINLSNNVIHSNSILINNDFSNTNINIRPKFFNNLNLLNAYNNNFENIDLSNITIPMIKYNDYVNNNYFNKNNFKNTNINIEFEKDKIDNNYYEDKELIISSFIDAIDNNTIEGCYVNNNPNLNEIKEDLNNYLSLQKKETNNKYNNVITDIENKILKYTKDNK